MSLDSATVRLKQNLNALEERQKNDNYLDRLRRSRVSARSSIERMDAMLGRGAIRAAIDAAIPKLAAVPDTVLRAELDMILSAAREHLR